MRNIILIVLILFNSTSIALAQKNVDVVQIPKKNEDTLLTQNNVDFTKVMPINNVSVKSVGLLGIIGVASLNYEMLVPVKSNAMVAGSFGVGIPYLFFGFRDFLSDKIYTSYHITGNIGENGHFFELGLSGMFQFDDLSRSFFALPLAGYRHQPLEKYQPNFRIFITPFMDDRKVEGILYGLSTGICF